MKKMRKKVLSVLLCGIILCAAMLCGACQGKSAGEDTKDKAAETAKETADSYAEKPAEKEADAPADTAPAPDEVTTIVMPYMLTMNPAEDRDLVQAAMNEKLLEKGYPVQVEFMCIDFPSWGQQINLLLADGQIDLFNCSFMESVGTLANKGALAPLDDLLDEYGQGIRDTLGDYLVCGKVGDTIYGTPKLAAYGNAPMYVMNQEMLDSAGISRDDIVDLETLTDALKEVHKLYPDVTMISTGAGGGLYDPSGLDWLGSDKPYACLKLEEGSDDLTVINYYATDEFKELLDLTQMWVDEGFIRKDAINYQDSSFTAMHDSSAFGTFAGYASEAITDSTYATAISVPNCASMLAEKAWITTGNVTGMTWCIPALSKHKEAAMIFLNALYTDPDIANIGCNGIEGVHYVLLDDGSITYADPETQSATTSGWPSGMGSFWPNMLIAYPWAPDTPASYEEWIRSNEESLNSPALGFVFDSSAVADEIAAVNNVIAKYYNPMMLHLGDSAKMLEDMLKELEQAGLNDIITEKQRQLDEWAAINK